MWKIEIEISNFQGQMVQLAHQFITKHCHKLQKDIHDMYIKTVLHTWFLYDQKGNTLSQYMSRQREIQQLLQESNHTLYEKFGQSSNRVKNFLLNVRNDFVFIAQMLLSQFSQVESFSADLIETSFEKKLVSFYTLFKSVFQKNTLQNLLQIVFFLLNDPIKINQVVKVAVSQFRLSCNLN